MTEKTLTTENIKPAIDALRGELAPWPVVAMKQDKLNGTQKAAINSGITSGLVAQIIANTAAIRALESAITGTGLRPLVVASLPAVGTQGILYIVPVTTYDPSTDADVVNYSNEYIWIVAPDAPVTQGYYEQVGQTGIVINNGQLTITVNGTSVGTFTANQSGNTTAAITVPTNADYVDKTTAQTVAGVKTFSDGIVGNVTGTASRSIADADGNTISSTYGKLAGSQTWTGSNTFSSITQTGTRYYRSTNNTKGTLPSSTAYYGVVNDYDSNSTVYSQTRGYISTAGTNANELTLTAWNTSDTVRVQTSISADGTTKNHTIGANTLPQTNSTYTLGTSSYRWSSVYADSYYYGTTAWGLDKANVWTGTQTIEQSTFAQLRLKNSTIKLGDAIPSSQKTVGTVIFSGSDNGNMGFMDFRDSALGNTYIRILARQKYDANGNRSTSGTTYESGIDIGVLNDMTPVVVPTSNAVAHLGLSTNKWKTLNGVNPGALSLPDYDETKALLVDTTGWTYDGSTANQLKINNATQTINGWLFIRIENVASTDRVVIRFNGNLASDPAMSFSPAGTGINLIMPIPANRLTNIYLTKAPLHIKLYPCLGNV